MPNPSTAELARVKQAASDVRASRVRYREAIARALEAKERAEDVADAAGVSRQAVYALTARTRARLDS